MKFLAALLHAIAASQTVFDSFLPLYDGATGPPISKDNSVSVRFRTPPEFSTPSGILSNSTELTLESVIFSLNTIGIPTNESLWLIANGNWTIVPAHENRHVPSLQVFAKN
ncbi:hypothetical protein DYB37_008072 [Aphanomyces astaci]|uniref:Uncharacterized protein n=1 Tax=Aphanomyces astaci TaxID=112090 RepID=A0A3R7B5Y1_APHAT|nr:hypothetical protein DYB37_008072 [Aphanomyces astaci]